jgi:hypothetical protein
MVQALVIDFQFLSRCAINCARRRSSSPSKTLMSSGSARKYTPTVRAFTVGRVSARVVK